MLNLIWGNIRKQFVRSGAVCLLPVSLYLVLKPVELFSGNGQDLTFRLWDFWGFFLLAAVLIWGVGSLILSALPEKLNYFFCTLALSLGIMSYLQGMVLNTKLSETDGSALHYQDLGSYYYWNLVIWIVGFILIFCLSYLMKQHFTIFGVYLPAFIGLVQIVTSVVVAMGCAGYNTTFDYTQSGDDEFALAKNSNVIVFMLDSYGNKVLEAALKQDPELLAGMEDFTYYNNADCGYYRTFPSVTHFLTGNEFDAGEECFQWDDESWSSERAEKFYNTLHEKGYTCNIYQGDAKYVFGGNTNLKGKFDNIVSTDREVKHWVICREMFKMSVFCFVPYVFKPYCEVLTANFSKVISAKGTKPLMTSDCDFLEELKKNGYTVSEETDNAFIYQALSGVHTPREMDEQGNRVFSDNTDLMPSAIGCFAMIREILDQLKAVGKYDSSTIIFMADHANWTFLKEDEIENDPQPILFVKRANESHDEMKISSAPVSWCDFQATIMESIGEDHSDYGTSFWDWEDGDTRERSVMARTYDPDMPAVSHKGTQMTFKNDFNAYRKYTYQTDLNELLEKMENQEYETIPASSWGTR